jgi:molybdopterin-guanine dinucleotide biosynthesis protein A
MSAIVVAGGVSKRFGQDKGLIKLAEKPLILYVMDTVALVVDEIVVVVNSKAQERKFLRVVKQKARVVIDNAAVQTPLVGALAGFETIQSEYSLLLACDTPFLSAEILRLLLDICINKSAVIPRWANGDIEPLQAGYHAKTVAKAAKAALGSGKLDMRSMITEMQNIRYISTTVLQQFDPKLITFFNLNTPNDLKKAEAIIEQHAY